MADVSAQARDRAGRTVAAAAVFAEHAELIAAALTEVPVGQVLVAVVDSGHQFTGTHHVPTATMVQRVPELEAGDGWAMVFPAGTTRADIHRRTAELADIARQRIAVIDRITARRSGREPTGRD